MLMQILTQDAAIAYVNAIETQWYGAPTGVKLAAHSFVNGWEDCPGIDVHTNENHWSVWLEVDGTIYGEC
jgi:hypothetical protein